MTSSQYLQRFGIHPLTDPRFNKVISLLKTHKLEQDGSEQVIDFQSNQLPETLDIEEFYRYWANTILRL